MSSLNHPFDPDRPLSRCSCGNHGSQSEHDIAVAAGDVDALNSGRMFYRGVRLCD